MRDDAPHVIWSCRGGDPWICTHCGRSLDPHRLDPNAERLHSIPVDVFLDICNGFIRRHRHCPAPPSEPGLFAWENEGGA